MISRSPHTSDRPSSQSLWKRLAGWLKWGFLFVLLALGVMAVGFRITIWQRQQAVLQTLGHDPMLNRQLLDFKFVKQEIIVDDSILKIKPARSKIINYFQTTRPHQEVFEQLVQEAERYGWSNFSFYRGNDSDIRFSSNKNNISLYVRVYSANKKSYRVYIEVE